MLTIDDVKQAMRLCGVDDGIDLDGDVADADLAELGYDSLAVLAITAHLQGRLDVRIPDEIVTEVHTPREIRDYINDRIAVG